MKVNKITFVAIAILFIISNMSFIVPGTTDKGVQWAADALSNRPWDLSGNLVLIRDKELDSLDTRTLTRGGLAVAVSISVPEMTPVATGEILATATPLPTLSPTPKAANVATYSEVGRPAWLLPLIAGTGADFEILDRVRDSNPTQHVSGRALITSGYEMNP